MHRRSLIILAFVRIFFAKLGIYFYESGNSHRYETQEHGNNKEHLIAKLHLQITGKQSGNHHAQSHECGTNGIMCSLAFAA